MSIFQNSWRCSFLRAAAAVTLLAAAPIAAQAMSAHGTSLLVVAPITSACDAGELARMGQLTHLDGKGAFISKRGDVVSLTSCPALKDRLIVANS